MVAVCEQCGNEYKTIPSWYKRSQHHFCSKPCSYIAHAEANKERIRELGKPFRYKPGHVQSLGAIEARIKGATGSNHASWKGEKVGYRGLHYWLRRVKGIPGNCTKCGKKGRNQWANIDGLYSRNPDEYIAMCPSCHKKYDIAIRAIRDSAAAI